MLFFFNINQSLLIILLSCKISKMVVIDSYLFHHYHSANICEVNNTKAEDSVIQT